MEWTSLDVFPQDFDNALEGKPFRNVLSSSEHLSELGSRQLLDCQVLRLGFVGGDVSLFLSVDQVQGRNGGDTQLLGVGLCGVLGIVGTVVVLSGDGRLGSGHITSNDEVCATEVLSDNHVLDGLTGSGHVHGVRKVFPEYTGVGSLFLQDLVSLVSNSSGDIVGLKIKSEKIRSQKGIW